MGFREDAECVGVEKRPLLTSRARVAIQVDKQIGWNELQEVDRTQKRQVLEEIGYLRRRQASNRTADLEDIW